MKIGNFIESPKKEVRSQKTGELFTLYRDLLKGTSISQFSVMHEELLPKHRTSKPHYHSTKDEIYFVLKGEPTVFANGTSRILEEGAYVVFEGGEQITHYLLNETHKTVELLTISSCSEDDIVHYQSECKK